jgi:hypothetical protein
MICPAFFVAQSRHPNGHVLWGVLTANRGNGYAETPEKATRFHLLGCFILGAVGTALDQPQSR